MASENKSISTVLAIAACALSLAASGDANWPGNQTDAYWEDVWGNVNDYYVFLNVPDATVRFRSFTTLPSNRPVWFDGSHVTFIGDDSGCGIQAGRNWNVSLTVGRDRGAGYLTMDVIPLQTSHMSVSDQALRMPSANCALRAGRFPSQPVILRQERQAPRGPF